MDTAKDTTSPGRKMERKTKDTWFTTEDRFEGCQTKNWMRQEHIEQESRKTCGPSQQAGTYYCNMCKLTEIQDLEDVQKRCPPQEDQHKKKQFGGARSIPSQLTMKFRFSVHRPFFRTKLISWSRIIVTIFSFSLPDNCKS